MKFISSVALSLFLMCANAYAEKSVLVVDDSSSMRQQLVYALVNLGYSKVSEAIDGFRALQIINQKTAPFDLVITDFNMPDMDGLQLTSAIRALPKYSRTPIILLTSENNPQLIAQARSLGVQNTLVKPFAPAVLKAKIESLGY